MRKIFFPATLSLLVATLLFVSCGSRGTSAEADGLRFDSIVKDTTLLLVQNADTGRCTLHMSVLFAQGKNAQVVNDTLLSSDIFWKVFCDSSLVGMTPQGALDTYTQCFIDNYRSEIEPLLSDGFGGPAATYSYDVRTTAEPGRDSTVAYVASIYAYTGGAHGSAETVAMNFDLNTGRKMGLDDVFLHGYEATTNKLITNHLLREFKARSLDDLRQQGLFFAQDVYTPSNFILSRDSITFIFMQDEIAPHALGEIRVTLSYKDLDGVLRH